MKKRMLGALLSTTMLTSLLVGGQALPSFADTAASAPAVGMYEDFEYMTNDTAASYWKFNTGDEPVFSIEDGKGENGSKALKLEFKGTGQGWSSYKLPIVPKGQAMTIWYRMEKDTQFALAFRKWEGSTWTDLGFVGLHKEDGNWSTTSVSAGVHKSTVKYSDSSDVTENNQDIMLGMEVGGTPGDIVIYIDSIQFHNVDGEGNLVDLPDSDGDQTALKKALAGKKELYDGNNADQAYTVKSYAAFKTAYEEASTLAADAKQSVVDYTLKKFNYYVNSLRPTNFDYTKIDEAIQAVDAFYATNPENTYTAHALGLLKGYYDAAKDMRTNVTGETQKNYDDAAAALANSLAQLKADGAKVTETPVYPKDAQDTLLDDFESYDGLADIPVGGGGGSTDDGWGLDTNESFKNRLDTTNPISGQKSLKISWTDLPDSVWGAFRLYMYHTGNYPLRNQAITFTIKVEFDYNMTIVLYNYSDPNQIYSTTVAIKGSKNPQTITVPFNQFTNSNKNSYGYGEPMTAERFASFKNQWNCLKIQVDRTCVPESGEMWLDCFKLTANEGPQEAAPPPDGQGGDSSDSSDSSGGESSGEIIEPDDPQPDESDGFHVLQNFEDMTAEKLAELFGTPSAGTLSLDTSKKLFGSNSMKLTYDFTGDSKSASIQAAFPGLRGDGLYLMVLSANDAVLTLKLSDGTLWTEYQVPVKGSDKEQMVFVNFVDTVSGKGTFDELNKAKITLSMTLSSEKAIAGDIYFDNIGYFLYDEMLENKTPDGGDSSNGGNSSNGGDSSNGGSTSSGGSDSSPSTGEAGGLLAVAGLGVLAAMAAIVVSRRKKTENISSDM